MSSSLPPIAPEDDEDEDSSPPCVLVFNASDPSGAGGLAADIAAMSSVGAHVLPVVTGAYARDTAEIFDFFPLDDEAIAEQARTVLEDVPVQVIKIGFCGDPENLSAIAQIAADYADVPVVAYMPDLSWWDETNIDAYLDAFRELVLPQTTVLVGNHSTLSRWLLNDWTSDRAPTARDLARAAGEVGVPYTLVTGIPLPEQFIENSLATPQTVLATEKFERFGAIFAGAGDTLSAALAALLATGTDLTAAASESLAYLDQCLGAGFRPGMGHVIPDRLFWAQPDTDEDDDDETDDAPNGSGILGFDIPPNDLKH